MFDPIDIAASGLTAERVFASARPPHEGVRIIRDGAGTLFDPELVGIFSGLVAPFPVGEPIELTDGRKGIVVSVPHGNLERPAVRVINGPDGPYEISLAAEPTVRIAGWDQTPASVAA